MSICRLNFEAIGDLDERSNPQGTSAHQDCQYRQR